jgi:hypothetical protein
MRSFSKISTPSNPAAAAAASLSSSVPDRHTVAMDRCTFLTSRSLLRATVNRRPGHRRPGRRAAAVA